MTTTTNSPTSLLSPESAAVIRATAGVVAEHAEQITARFYPRMFGAHPELLRVFNKGNQATGEQSRALAASVVAYAVHLIDPDAPPSTTSCGGSPSSTSPSGSGQSSTPSSVTISSAPSQRFWVRP